MPTDSQQHVVNFTKAEILAALKAHYPDMRVQAIPGDNRATMERTANQIQFSWTRMNSAQDGGYSHDVA